MRSEVTVTDLTNSPETRVRGERVLGSAGLSKSRGALLTGWGSRATRDPLGSPQ